MSQIALVVRDPKNPPGDGGNTGQELREAHTSIIAGPRPSLAV
jgi:hypothetical protein